MRAVVSAQIDPLSRDRHAGDERRDELVLRPDEREHRAVVICVAVHVEQPRARGERVADRVDRRAIAPLGEVRHGLEHAHALTLGAVKEYYDTRAPEYDDWYLGLGGFADRDRPGWEDELAELARRDRAAPAEADARRRLRHRLPHASSARRRHRPRPERADARDRAGTNAERHLRPGRRARAPVSRR